MSAANTPALCKLCAAPLPLLGPAVLAADIQSIYRQDWGIELAAVAGPPPAPRLHLLRCAHCSLRQYWPDWVAAPALYRALQGQPWYYQADKPEFRAAAAHIGPAQAVLDIGCGSGRFQSHLAPGTRYVGLELNPAAVAQAQGLGLDVRALALPGFAAAHGACFDAVAAFQVLEHVPQPAEFLQDMARLARPGGLVICSVPADDAFLGHEINNVLNLPPHHCTRWPDAALAQVAARLGLQALHTWHEPLAAGHRRALALNRVWGAWLRLSAQPARPLTLFAQQRWRRRAAAAAGLPVRALLRLLPEGEGGRGHTSTLVMRKPLGWAPGLRQPAQRPAQ